MVQPSTMTNSVCCTVVQALVSLAKRNGSTRFLTSKLHVTFVIASFQHSHSCVMRLSYSKLHHLPRSLSVHLWPVPLALMEPPLIDPDQAMYGVRITTLPHLFLRYLHGFQTAVDLVGVVEGPRPRGGEAIPCATPISDLGPPLGPGILFSLGMLCKLVSTPIPAGASQWLMLDNKHEKWGPTTVSQANVSVCGKPEVFHCEGA